MGIYKATVADPGTVRLEHQDPSDPHVIEFRGNPVPAYITAIVERGEHYIASFGFTKLVEGPTTTGPTPSAETPDPGAAVTREGLPSFPAPAEPAGEVAPDVAVTATPAVDPDNIPF